MIRRALVIGYLLILVLGAAYAVFRFQPVPFGPVTMFMYGMLAPYQGYRETSEAFLVEGETDGEWRTIDLAPYFPVLEGERSMREIRMYQNLARFPTEADNHRATAERIRVLEAAAGRSYDRVRLTWVQWKPRPSGYWDGFDEPLQTRFLVIVP